jgi:hypothetical protein
MKPANKINLLALISFISGLTALLTIGIIFAIYNFVDPTEGILFITDGILMPVRNLAVFAALVTGILALINIKKSGGAERGKLYAWVGIVLGGGWLLFGLLVGLTFLLSNILQ